MRMMGSSAGSSPFLEPLLFLSANSLAITVRIESANWATFSVYFLFVWVMTRCCLETSHSQPSGRLAVFDSMKASRVIFSGLAEAEDTSVTTSRRIFLNDLKADLKRDSYWSKYSSMISK